MGAESEELPQASAAAWSPDAAPPPPRSQLLAFDELIGQAPDEPAAAEAPAEPGAGASDPVAADPAEPVHGAEPVESPAAADPIWPFAPAGPAEPVGTADPVDSSSPADSAESAGGADPAESLGAAEPVESSTPADAAEALGAGDAVESLGAADAVESPGAADAVESLGAADAVESPGAADAVESLGAADPMESSTPADPVEPLGAAEPVEPLAAAEPVEPLAAAEPVEPLAAAEPAEPSAATDPAEPSAEQPAADPLAGPLDPASAVRFMLPAQPVPKAMPGLENNFGLQAPPEHDGLAPPEPAPPAAETVSEPAHDPLADVKFVLPPAPEPVPEPEPQVDEPPEAAPELQWDPEPAPYAPLDPAPAPEPDPEPTVDAERPDRLGALRDLARKLRTAPDAEATLQFVVEISCRCTGSHAGMLTVMVPENRQVVWGTALGAGPYISVQLRAGGPSFGELVLTRMADAPEFEPQDETFAELVGEYVAKAVGAMRRGTLLSEEQQDFIDRVTEELRSPLAGAVNLIGTVLDGQATPEEADTYLRRSVEDSKRMLRLIDDLLHIARLRPPEPREMEPMPVGPWIERSVESFRERAEAAGHTLTLAKPSGAYVLKAVPSQLDLVMHHLLDNAIKFSEQPGPIDVSITPVEGLLRVCVADQGIGFDSSDASRMLDCFSRAINAEAARIPGAGIGLFLASEIVKGHGGRLWLESRRDAGTQVYAALPYDE